MVRVEYGWENDVEGYTPKGHKTYRNAALALARALLLLEDNYTVRLVPEKTLKPKTFIQWKGTNLCMDLYCECGASHHYDGLFAYFIRCPACGRVYAMPEDVGSKLVVVPKELQVDKLMVLDPNEFYDGEDY